MKVSVKVSLKHTNIIGLMIKVSVIVKITGFCFYLTNIEKKIKVTFLTIAYNCLSFSSVKLLSVKLFYILKGKFRRFIHVSI